jgi:hypothetical protein
MRALLTILLAVVFAVVGTAQERRAFLVLDDGEEVQGTVVSMDLAQVQLRVGETVRTFDAARIRQCRVEEVTPPPAPAGEGAPPAEGAPRAESAPVAAPPSAEQKDLNKDAAKVGTPPVPAPRVSWQGPLQAPPDTEPPAPHDLRHETKWRSRLRALDEAYPWLVPAAPVQWCSIGLLLVILLSLCVYLSVNVAGAEGASIHRSIVVAAWYVLITCIQVAAVPTNDLAIALMLLANPTFALFWLCGLFGLSRISATIAFAVQIGFCVLGWGVVEMVTSLLASISPVS